MDDGNKKKHLNISLLRVLFIFLSISNICNDNYCCNNKHTHKQQQQQRKQLAGTGNTRFSPFFSSNRSTKKILERQLYCDCELIGDNLIIYYYSSTCCEVHCSPWSSGFHMNTRFNIISNIYLRISYDSCLFEETIVFGLIFVV